MTNSVIPRAGYNFHFFADHLDKLDELDDFETRGHTNHVTWNPSGVAVVITPWNAPLMLATWRIAPALAAGDAVIAKPPEWAPLTASLLADITRDAGMPDGAFNVVQGIGEEAGAALVAHPDVGRVAFTGSVATGKLVAASAGANLTPVSLELGGKAPFLIFADTDLDAAVKQAVNQFDNAGQVCLAGHAAPRRGRDPRRVPRAVHRGVRRDPTGRPAGGDDRHRAADHPGALRPGRRLRAAGEGRGHRGRVRRRAERGARRPLLPADAVPRATARRRDRPTRGVRPGPHPPAVLRRRTRASRSRTTRPTACRRSSTRATAIARSGSRRPSSPAPSG